ncbi:acyl carrier protein [Saccharothrix carnea]|uniref:Acyl carrier protein n=1 Tax=Saccharothrix carnea TaxID=1280637 RepID=A0A2P8I0M4_SACCR|nr:acyl carrier protein [Saccharothrix carnea]PSL51993.1 acyl carrier protein [Saccharothrix carnea]
MNEELKRIMVDDLNLDEAALRPETSLENAGLDSLTIVELSVNLSEQLGLQISEEELQRAATVGEIEQLVEQRRREA